MLNLYESRSFVLGGSTRLARVIISERRVLLVRAAIDRIIGKGMGVIAFDEFHSGRRLFTGSVLPVIGIV